MFRNALTPRLLAAARRIARERSTPFVLFEPARLRAEARSWRDAVRARQPAGLFYPYKCNRHPSVVETLAREGLGAEVTSIEDLLAARRLGLSGARLVIQGPAKERSLIDAGLACGALFVADGSEDASAILARGRALSKAPAYLLRLAAASAQLEQRAFGLPARELTSLAREIRRRDGPRPCGLAFHLGTGIASTVPYERAILEAAEVARDVADSGIRTTRLDLGGGFAARTESRLDERGRPTRRGKAPSELLPTLARRARRLLGPQVELLLEPGRALVSASMHLVARAVTAKSLPRSRTVYLDASRLSHAFFVRQGRHPIASIPRRPGASNRVTLAGPLGVGLDVFASARLPPMEPDDLVVIGSIGAYNVNAMNTWAGAVPPVLSIRSGRARR